MTGKLLPILIYPDERLHISADVVTAEELNGELAGLALDMIYTMQTNNGIGLAATQVGINKRMIVVVYNGAPLVLVNPEIISMEGQNIIEEGCLSVPGFFADKTRWKSVTVSYQTLTGAKVELATFDLFAACLQHEIEHLDGRLFVDGYSEFKKSRVIKKIEKTLRERSRYRE